LYFDIYFLFKSGLCGKRRFLWLGSKLTENLKDFKLEEGGAIMNLSLFSEVLFNRLKFLLVRHPEEIEENWIKHLPPEFDLMSLAELEKGCKISPLKLEELLDFDIQESNIREITKARHAVIAILDYFKIQVEWDGDEKISQEEGSETEKDQQKKQRKSNDKPAFFPESDDLDRSNPPQESSLSDSSREKDDIEEKLKKEFPRSFKKRKMALAWTIYDPGSSDESFREALARSLNNLSLADWVDQMEKALKKAGIKGVEVKASDYSNFKNSAILRGLIGSESGL